MPADLAAARPIAFLQGAAVGAVLGVVEDGLAFQKRGIDEREMWRRIAKRMACGALTRRAPQPGGPWTGRMRPGAVGALAVPVIEAPSGARTTSWE